ncbi:MAG: hypothetical protein U0166_24540 [Acidobacteriota bacterium]
MAGGRNTSTLPGAPSSVELSCGGRLRLLSGGHGVEALIVFDSWCSRSAGGVQAVALVVSGGAAA